LNIKYSDLYFTIDGDFALSETGDIKSTYQSTDIMLGLKQFILHRIIGERGGWTLHPQITAGIPQFIGRVVDDDLLTAMTAAVKTALTIDNVLGTSGFNIRCLDLGNAVVAVVVWIRNWSDKPIFNMAVNIQTGAITQIK
jgi:hypothetical protein